MSIDSQVNVFVRVCMSVCACECMSVSGFYATVGNKYKLI